MQLRDAGTSPLLDRAIAVYVDWIGELPVESSLLWEESTSDAGTQMVTYRAEGDALGYRDAPEPGDVQRPFITFGE
jgi:hypothetical protein